MTAPDPLPRCPHGNEPLVSDDRRGIITIYSPLCDCMVESDNDELARAAWHALCHADGWIACSERLPESGVLVILADADHACVGLGERTASGISFHGYAGEHEHPVATHWRALPEPPQGEREG